jgi:hypothetical protein
VQVLEQDDAALLLPERLNHAPHDVEDLALARLGVDARSGVFRIGNAHEVEVEGKALAQAFVQQEDAAGDALARGGVAVQFGDAVKGAKEPLDRKEGDRLALGDAGGLVGHHAPGAAAFEELVAKSALAQPRLADDADDLRVPRAGVFQGGLEHLHFVAASDEVGKSAAAGDIQSRAHASEPLELIDMHRILHAFDFRRAQIDEGEVSLHLGRRVGREVDLARLGDLFHASREADGVSLRGILHAQVFADFADDDLAGVDAQSHRKIKAASEAQLVCVGAQALDHVQGRIAGPAGVILVGKGRAEQGHDAVAGELVDESLEALHALGKNKKEALHDLRPRFGVHAFRQLHRAAHVREQNRDLLAFAFERGLHAKNSVGQMPGSGVVGAVRRARVGGT